MKPNIETLPCFEKVAKVIGRERAKIELIKAVGWRKWFENNQVKGDCDVKNARIWHSFSWGFTPQKWKFWNDVNQGINPYTGEKVE